jgi:hypothetical protein
MGTRHQHQHFHYAAYAASQTMPLYGAMTIANLKLKPLPTRSWRRCLDELKALHLPDGYAAKLRAARRPKPPSLKEQALAVLMALEIDEPGYEGTYNTIRRALESLPND